MSHVESSLLAFQGRDVCIYIPRHCYKYLIVREDQTLTVLTRGFRLESIVE